MTDPDPTAVPSIVTPCHGVPLLVLTTMEGSGHLTRDVPDEIVCSADGCYNSWSADGTSDPYNKMPDRSGGKSTTT